MAQASAVPSNNGDSVRVGTTGTIGTLMTRELESMKPIQTSDSSRKKPQTPPVSVPCGSTPRKSHPRRNPPNELIGGGSGGGGGNCMPRKNGHRYPILNSDTIPTDGNRNREKPEKKGPAYLVEVVDLKCGNPMSSRLKKLGFSKLSDSVV